MICVLDYVSHNKARWSKKGFLKCSRKSPTFVDYADAFEPASTGFPGDAMEGVRLNFASLVRKLLVYFLSFLSFRVLVA